jgi:hypothetical protein
MAAFSLVYLLMLLGVVIIAATVLIGGGIWLFKHLQRPPKDESGQPPRVDPPASGSGQR